MSRRLRDEPFIKQPGAAETIDWARAVAELRLDQTDGHISPEEIRRTLGCMLKEAEDIERVDDELLGALVEAAQRATGASSSTTDVGQ